MRKKRLFSAHPSLHSSTTSHSRKSSASKQEIESLELRDFPVIKVKKQPKILKSVNSSAGTLTAIVLLYMICNVPRLILNLAEYLLYPAVYEADACGCSQTPTWFSILCRVSHLLLIVNSSCNFLIYFSIGRRFKKLTNSNLQYYMRNISRLVCVCQRNLV